MTENKKEQSLYQGISNLKLRKLRSGDAQNTGTEGNLLTVFGKRFMTPLDFEIITDHARAVSSTYLNGVTMYYDFVTFFKELTIPLNETLTNININVMRRSYKGILMLCFDADRNDSEELKT